MARLFSLGAMRVFYHIVGYFWILSFLLQQIVFTIILRRLRRVQPLTWKQLGEPYPFMPTRKFVLFVWRQGFAVLPDERIVVIGRAARWLLVSQTLLLIATLLFYAYNLYFPGHG
jgi:hypothetical protein